MCTALKMLRKYPLHYEISCDTAENELYEVDILRFFGGLTVVRERALQGTRALNA